MRPKKRPTTAKVEVEPPPRRKLLRPMLATQLKYAPELWPLAFALAAGCAAAPCSDAQLTAVADDGPRLSNTEYVDKIAVACPKLPPVLHESLKASAEGMSASRRAAREAERAGDPQWQELAAKACPPSDGPTAPGRNRDDRQRLRCDFDRFGLLDDKDPYIARDFEVFVLLTWLRAVEIEPALAKRVVKPLLAATASDSELEALCWAGEGGCRTAMYRRGLSPLTSTTDGKRRGGVEVTITPQELRVASRPVLALKNRRVTPSASAFAPLRSAIASGDKDAPVSWVVDNGTFYRTFIDAAFATVKAGRQQAELVVFDGVQPAALDLAWPQPWQSPGEARSKDSAPRLRVTVMEDEVLVRAPDIDRPEWFVPLTCGSNTRCERELAGIAEEYHRAFPKDPVVHLDAEDTVRMQTVVDVIDALRGKDCRLNGVMRDGRAPRECLQWQPILDARPSLPPRPDRPALPPVGDQPID